MTETEAVHLAREIAKALQAARSVSDSEHYDHHVWIMAQIEHEKARKVFWQQLSLHVARWGAVSLISVGGYALYLGLKQMAKAGM